ncbi:MAG: copper transporter [Promicromonosporaceae bacterium]|nr:copper transporter [Promicromonosporaceae bacterium]
MIDFRYHLVSLISVFLALAVGIILGAGPLQGTIGDTLNDQVDSLRSERNDLRDSLNASQADAQKSLKFIQAAGPSLVAGSLEGRRVAIVDLEGAAPAVQEGVAGQIQAAGGTVAVVASVGSSWTDADHKDFRETIANGLRPRLTGGEADLPQGATPEQVLSAALAVALAGTSVSDARSEDAAALEQQLVQANLITLDGEQAKPADAVVLLAGAVPAAAPQGASPEPTKDVVASMVTLAKTAQSVVPVVVAGPTVSSGDVVSGVRDDKATAAKVTTVSGVETPIGQIVVPLAVAAQLGGQAGQYGFEDGATPLPPIVRPSTAVTSGTSAGGNG